MRNRRRISRHTLAASPHLPEVTFTSPGSGFLSLYPLLFQFLPQAFFTSLLFVCFYLCCCCQLNFFPTFSLFLFIVLCPLSPDFSLSLCLFVFILTADIGRTVLGWTPQKQQGWETLSCCCQLRKDLVFWGLIGPCSWNETRWASCRPLHLLHFRHRRRPHLHHASPSQGEVGVLVHLSGKKTKTKNRLS